MASGNKMAALYIVCHSGVFFSSVLRVHCGGAEAGVSILPVADVLAHLIVLTWKEREREKKKVSNENKLLGTCGWTIPACSDLVFMNQNTVISSLFHMADGWFHSLHPPHHCQDHESRQLQQNNKGEEKKEIEK